MKDTILSIIRHALTFGGGYLAAKGIVSNETINSVGGALMTLIGAVWGAADEYIAAHKNK